LLLVVPIRSHHTTQNKRQAAPKQEKKEASKKGKRVKFDPANMKSVTQLQKVRCWCQEENWRAVRVLLPLLLLWWWWWWWW
jgi:hypothetical protein